MLETADHSGEFAKHLYAIETLIKILKEESPGDAVQEEAGGPGLTEKDEKMLELMGGSGKQAAPQEDKRADDSIFDF